jgi:hypothetical protein
MNRENQEYYQCFISSDCDIRGDLMDGRTVITFSCPSLAMAPGPARTVGHRPVAAWYIW